MTHEKDERISVGAGMVPTYHATETVDEARAAVESRRPGTEDLRRMLDERGVEYETCDDTPFTSIPATFWHDYNGDMCSALECVEATNGGGTLEVSMVMTPEQAVAATLGPEMSDGLKPCPFCGGKAYLFCDSDNDNPFFDDGTSEFYWQVKHNCEMPRNAVNYFVESDFLCFRTPWYKDKHKAIDVWNRRDG